MGIFSVSTTMHAHTIPLWIKFASHIFHSPPFICCRAQLYLILNPTQWQRDINIHGGKWLLLMISTKERKNWHLVNFYGDTLHRLQEIEKSMIFINTFRAMNRSSASTILFLFFIILLAGALCFWIDIVSFSVHFPPALSSSLLWIQHIYIYIYRYHLVFLEWKKYDNQSY
jgi:hypothetical protein